MIFKPVIAGGGSAGFSGTANITWFGPLDYFHIAYLNESMQLVQLKGSLSLVFPPSSIPVPQIVYVAISGRNESVSCSGDFEQIDSFSSPPGKVIYVTGDITITSS